jgi:DNA modification methylase
LTAAIDLGWTSIACVRTGLDRLEAKAFAIADNRTAELATWDEQALASAMVEIGDDLAGMTGFSAKELAETLGTWDDGERKDEVDAKPELADLLDKEWKVKLGQVWAIGDHRLLCGDSLDSASVEVLLAGQKIDCVLTDPPYGVAYSGGIDKNGVEFNRVEIKNDELTGDELYGFLSKVFQTCFDNSRPGAYWYSSVGVEAHSSMYLIWKKLGVYRQNLVWVKDRPILGRGEYQWAHEPILYGQKPLGESGLDYEVAHADVAFGWVPGKRHVNKDRARRTTWHFPKPNKSEEHPTMKPIPLWMRAVNDGSRRGELIFDPFLGSGTTMIASDNLKRRCYGIELDPRYCAVILQRMSDMGFEPELLDG